MHALNGSSMLHDRIKENKDNTAQWPTEPGQVTFACFRVLREKGESEVK